MAQWRYFFDKEERFAFMQRQWVCTNCWEGNTYGTPPYCMWCGAPMEEKEGDPIFNRKQLEELRKRGPA